MSVTTALKRRAALSAAVVAAAATLAVLATGPAEATTWGEATGDITYYAASGTGSVQPGSQVRPETVGYPDCGENFAFNSNYVRIRDRWGTSSTVLGYGMKGQTFDGEYRTSYEYNGYFWVYGYDFETGVTGYVALSLLVPQGPVGCTVLS